MSDTQPERPKRHLAAATADEIVDALLAEFDYWHKAECEDGVSIGAMGAVSNVVGFATIPRHRAEWHPKKNPTSPWIPAGERLPEAVYGPKDCKPILSDDVVVLWPKVNMTAIANYDHESRTWTEANDSAREFDCEPDFWMPLPARPE